MEKTFRAIEKTSSLKVLHTRTHKQSNGQVKTLWFTMYCVHMKKCFQGLFNWVKETSFIRRRGEKIQSHSSIVRSNISYICYTIWCKKQNLETSVKILWRNYKHISILSKVLQLRFISSPLFNMNFLEFSIIQCKQIRYFFLFNRIQGLLLIRYFKKG